MTASQVVRRFIARVNVGSVQSALELVREDAEWVTRKGTRLGLDAARAYAERHGPQDYILRELVIEQLIERPGALVVLLDIQTRWMEDEDHSAIDHSRVGAHVTVDDGRISRWQTFSEQDEALRAAGLA